MKVLCKLSETVKTVKLTMSVASCFSKTILQQTTTWFQLLLCVIMKAKYLIALSVLLFIYQCSPT